MKRSFLNMVIYDHNSKILKHVVRKCHINSTYPSTAHMLSCVQLDILQSGVQQHEEGGGQHKRIYNNERNENEESQIAQKITYLREPRLFKTCNYNFFILHNDTCSQIF